MKWIKSNWLMIIFGLIIAALVVLIPVSFKELNRAADTCHKAGGVFFESRGSHICIKKDSVIQ
jgi:hypothetical protein